MQRMQRQALEKVRGLLGGDENKTHFTQSGPSHLTKAQRKAKRIRQREGRKASRGDTKFKNASGGRKSWSSFAKLR